LTLDPDLLIWIPAGACPVLDTGRERQNNNMSEKPKDFLKTENVKENKNNKIQLFLL